MAHTMQPTSISIPVNVLPFQGDMESGLECLKNTDFLDINQEISLLEVFTDLSSNLRFSVSNRSGQRILFMAEESDCCERYWCTNNRSFMMHVVNPNTNQEVMRFTKEFKCCSGCCWCAGCSEHCSWELNVEAPVGTIIGYIKQKGSCWKSHIEILDAHRQPIFKIKQDRCCLWDGPCCPCDNKFEITDDKNPIGDVTKIYAGFCKEWTYAHNFNINYPVDLPVKAKALILGSLILLDFMHYVKKNNNNDNNS